MQRVYVPATFVMLEELAQTGTLAARGGWGFALTPELRNFYTAGDEEELAYAAFEEASLASLRLLANGDEEKFPHRRVVISLDVEDSQVSSAAEMGEAVVKLQPATFSPENVAAIHIDVAEAEAQTAQAVAAIDAADLGDEDAELRVGDALDNLMAFYDPTELPFLIELL